MGGFVISHICSSLSSLGTAIWQEVSLGECYQSACYVIIDGGIWVLLKFGWNPTCHWVFQAEKEDPTEVFLLHPMLTTFVGFLSFGVDFWIWVHGEEAVMFVNPRTGKQRLCIAKEMYITSIWKFSYYSSITRKFGMGSNSYALCLSVYQTVLEWETRDNIEFNGNVISTDILCCVMS